LKSEAISVSGNIILVVRSLLQTPWIASMPISGKERQKKWRDKQLADGKRRLTVWIDAEACQSLDRLKKQMQTPTSAVVCRALRQLDEAVTTVPSRMQASTSDSANTSPVTAPRPGKIVQEAPAPDATHEKDRGIGQARAMIRRLLSLND
jgi:hypothetical protein